MYTYIGCTYMMYMSYMYIHPYMYIDVSYICACATEFKYVEVLIEWDVHMYRLYIHDVHVIHVHTYMYVHRCVIYVYIRDT